MTANAALAAANSASIAPDLYDYDDQQSDSYRIDDR
jgi:hypothetical protein